MTLSDFQTADKVFEKTMHHAKGKITIMSPKDGKYGFRMDQTPGLEGVWINGQGEAPGQVGDEIEMEYSKSPKDVNGTGNQGFWYNPIKIINLSKKTKDEGILTALGQESKPTEAISKRLNGFSDYISLFNSAVALCIRRGTILDAEIIRTFGSFLDWIETYTEVSQSKLKGANANTKTVLQEKKNER